ncbi:mRNA capping enzyme-domain-containing protein [Truncatella angustata]|uniref:mRNA cap guanine-N(7) methyltransferase n=1 Tax=Truncatella angustata TaxID=152316 RepID=A0A9P8ZRY4_9PEZI|nr:mRNA capping enzyme-domain-containing protein [Truncatella angustata]KAH6648000.1 mRNA capping enzyme-domain-containing protein [Truncatella angustata]KAH8194374.1 hypothetical protein TruAng_011457 [Truncatella angustata]
MASDDERSPRPRKRLVQRKQSYDRSPDRNGSRTSRRDEPDLDQLPQPYDAKKLEPAKKRQRSRSPSDAPRKQKRPGRVARLSSRERDEAKRRQEDRERAAAQAAEHAARGAINDVVRQHYNAVPERGRDWRKTDSNIKGLRSFNNWVKSTIIQKFSPDEDHTPGAHEQGRDLVGVGGKELLVLDLGCGKGGDLGKWQQAPQSVQLYVGLDPAEVSIQQALDRYRQMGQRGGRGGRGGHRGGRHQRLFEAYFYPKDCFGTSIADIDIIRDVGFESSMGSRGFDIVSMMFCMHYAFETEAKARQMLKNVSGALKKGGRLIGCIPNSDIIGEKVTQFNERMAAKKAEAADGEAPPSDDHEEGEAEQTAEWGNKYYRVRFPGKTPEDGIFRPPFGWKYNFFLDEAVEEVPEYVVPWEAFRALAEDYNLELQWHESFKDIWEKEKDDRTLGPLSERMGVRERGGGDLLVSPEEMEVANFYVAFCFYKV